MLTRRQRQVAELLHEELGGLIQRRLKDPRLGFTTVTGVEVTADLRTAHVFISVLNVEEQEALEGLRSAASFLRRELARTVSLRYMPDLTFHLDRSLEHGLRIDALLDQIGPATGDSPADPPDLDE